MSLSKASVAAILGTAALPSGASALMMNENEKPFTVTMTNGSQFKATVVKPQRKKTNAPGCQAAGVFQHGAISRTMSTASSMENSNARRGAKQSRNIIIGKLGPQPKNRVALMMQHKNKNNASASKFIQKLETTGEDVPLNEDRIIRKFKQDLQKVSPVTVAHGLDTEDVEAKLKDVLAWEAKSPELSHGHHGVLGVIAGFVHWRDEEGHGKAVGALRQIFEKKLKDLENELRERELKELTKLENMLSNYSVDLSFSVWENFPHPPAEHTSWAKANFSEDLHVRWASVLSAWKKLLSTMKDNDTIWKRTDLGENVFTSEVKKDGNDSYATLQEDLKNIEDNFPQFKRLRKTIAESRKIFKDNVRSVGGSSSFVHAVGATSPWSLKWVQLECYLKENKQVRVSSDDALPWVQELHGRK